MLNTECAAYVINTDRVEIICVTAKYHNFPRMTSFPLINSTLRMLLRGNKSSIKLSYLHLYIYRGLKPCFLKGSLMQHLPSLSVATCQRDLLTFCQHKYSERASETRFHLNYSGDLENMCRRIIWAKRYFCSPCYDSGTPAVRDNPRVPRTYTITARDSTTVARLNVIPADLSSEFIAYL